MNNDYVHHLFEACNEYDNTDGLSITITDDYWQLTEAYRLLHNILTIAQSTEELFSIRRPSGKIRYTRLGEKLKSALLYPPVLPEDLTLHPTVVLFYKLAKQKSLQVWIQSMGNCPDRKLTHCLNLLLAEFRREVNSCEHKATCKKYKRAALKNQREAIKYVDNLFERYAKLLVVRIDFSYQDEFKQKITSEITLRHRKRLCKNMESNPLFEHCVGFICKLEYGKQRGYHYHALFFFNGAKVRQDIVLAKAIGEYWRDFITEGQGHYFNCNAKKEVYKTPGIGQVTYANTHLREGLKKVVGYMAKVDTFARLSLPGNARSFWRGKMKTLSEKRQRRPRKSINNSV